jgi:formamidase
VRPNRVAKGVHSYETMDSDIKDEVFVDEYTGGLVGPSLGFAATIRDDGRIRCVVPPGCWVR